MTKRRKSNKKNSSNNKIIIGAIIVVLALISGVIFILSGSNESEVADNSSPKIITAQDYQSNYLQSNTDHILLDVRTPEEFTSGYIPGAINIPLQELDQRLSELPQDIDIVVYCRSGNRSAQAVTILSNNGFDNVSDMGGIIAWQQAGYYLDT